MINNELNVKDRGAKPMVPRYPGYLDDRDSINSFLASIWLLNSIN